jgi:SAM-dependent methyltransferase
MSAKPLCPACGSSDSKGWAEKAGCALFTCASCGTRFADVPKALEPPETAYDDLYTGTSFAVPASVEPHLAALVESMEPYRSTGRWLDIGFGAGGLLRAAEARGWHCSGTEASGAALEYGKSRGWRVARASDDPVLGGSFDAVTLIELIEHLDQPRPILNAAATGLRPGGILHLTTPNANSLNRRVLGADWSVVAPPDHRTLFTRRGLEAALRSAGLRVAKVRTTGLNPSELFSGSRGHSAAAERVATGYKLNAALTATPARQRIKRAANALLSLLDLGDTLKAWAMRS